MLSWLAAELSWVPIPSYGRGPTARHDIDLDEEFINFSIWGPWVQKRGGGCCSVYTAYGIHVQLYPPGGGGKFHWLAGAPSKRAHGEGEGSISGGGGLGGSWERGGNI